MAFRSDYRQSTLGRKLFVVVSLFVGIVLFVFLLGAYRSMILSSVRAYTQGEDYWSKGQKEAVISLMQYASSRSQADFQAYLNAIRAPLGEKFARIELEKPAPDMTIVYQGFTRGQISPGWSARSAGFTTSPSCGLRSLIGRRGIKRSIISPSSPISSMRRPFQTSQIHYNNGAARPRVNRSLRLASHSYRESLLFGTGGG